MGQLGWSIGSANIVPLFRVSLAILALQCIDQNSTIKLLQTMKILAEVGQCQKCGQSGPNWWET